MTRRADLTTLAVAVAVHALFVLAIGRARLPVRHAPSTVELEFPHQRPLPAARTAPAAVPAARAAEAAAPRHKVALRPHPAAPSRPVAEPPVAPAKAAPAKPVFGVAMSSTTEVAEAPALPQGTSAAIPGHPGAAIAGRAAGASRGSDGEGDYQPVSESDVATMPEVDTDACGKTIVYPSEAEQAGIEGDVRLRVSLTPEGRVYAVRVLSGLGHGLDRAAAEALKHRCRFSPAIGKAGKPVAFVIQSYTFHFQLPR